ncbi:hypothetical protein BDAP_002766, partial [Binucleata daphniae]
MSNVNNFEEINNQLNKRNPTMTNTDKVVCGKILAYREQGMTVRQIEDKMKIPKST